MIATEYAKLYNIEPQQEGESDLAFRSRVAGALRKHGLLVEAHEAYSDAYFDQSDGVMTGLVGAAAQAMQGVDYGKDGQQQVGDDIAAGYLVEHPKPKDDALLLLLSALMR
jgi:hypothetical protein